MYYSILYEENQKGYLLKTTSDKLETLEILQFVLDDFIENDYIFSDKIFKIKEKFKVSKSYRIISHREQLKSTESFYILSFFELENSFIYHIKTSSEFFDMEELPRESLI